MLRTFKNKEKKTTTALVEDCSMDAINSVAKRLDICSCMFMQADDIFCTEQLLMNDTYRATVKCDPRDEYVEETGESLAVKKAMDNHKAAFKRAIIRWQAAMIKKVMNVSPETFNEALNKVYKCNNI